MSNGATSSGSFQPPLRLWPGLLIVACLWACLKVPALVIPGEIMQFYFVFFAPMILTVLFLVWWVFFSRARWSDRWMGLVVATLFGVVAYFCFHPTVGFMGLIMTALPLVLTAWIGWLLISSFLSPSLRRAGFIVVILLAWAYPALLRMDGVTGSFVAQVSYRWEPTAEELFQAERASRNTPEVAEIKDAKPVSLQPGDWPEFRGQNRDSRVPGVRIATDWQKNPPKLLWKQRIGPGWSSFSVIGNHLYTQEQRGGEEVVVCYDADTGKEIWVHKDAERFFETVSGAGPRATPAFSEGKIFALGASGRLNCLDAATGKLIWTHDIVADSSRDEKDEKRKTKVPMWGFSASPLVVKGLVTVFAGGPEGNSILAYKADTGDLAWSAGKGKVSYGSTQLLHIDGKDAIVMITENGLTAFEPLKGEVLWEHSWENPDGMPRVVQPNAISDSDVLIGTVDKGLRRVHFAREGDALKSNEVWTTTAIKPYFSDFVVHKDHLYGFGGVFFNCINLADGKLKWKERGYGSGQVLLLPDQDLLVILSEKGETALVEAYPEKHHEICRLPMIQGKTWNHPVIAHGKLFVRNDEEIACYQLNEQTTAAK